MNNFYCQFCKKHYRQNDNLRVHVKDFHPEVFLESTTLKTDRMKNDQKCPLCNFTSNVRIKIENHLSQVHAIEEVSSCQILYFLTKDEFLKWKLDLERSTDTEFIQPCADQVTKDVKTTYYYCSRSANFNSKVEEKRVMSLRGSSKINGFCPAKIKVIENVNEGIEVHFTDTHIGHENELCHINISKELPDEIVMKISQNVPLDSILSEIRQIAESDSKYERLKLITKNDLLNIKSTYSSCKSALMQESDLKSDDNADHSKFEYCGVDSTTDILYNGPVRYEEGEPLELDNYIIESDDLSDIKNYLLEKFTNIVNQATTVEDLKVVENFLKSVKNYASEIGSGEHPHP